MTRSDLPSIEMLRTTPEIEDPPLPSSGVGRHLVTLLLAVVGLGVAVVAPVGFWAVSGAVVVTAARLGLEHAPQWVRGSLAWGPLAVAGFGSLSIFVGWAATGGGAMGQVLALRWPRFHAPARLAHLVSMGLQAVPWLVLALYAVVLAGAAHAW